MDRGTKLEAWAIQQYELETGNLVTPTGFWVHPDWAWLGASPDGMVDDDGMVETKVPHAIYSAVPPHYRTQMIVQLAVTERKWCDFFAINDQRAKFALRVEHRLLESDAILGRLNDFYEKYIRTRKPPGRKKA